MTLLRWWRCQRRWRKRHTWVNNRCIICQVGVYGESPEEGDAMFPSIASVFDKAAQWTSAQCGKAYTFVASFIVILIWAAIGPLFGFSDTWQLVINTGTTVVTFLIVFLIQNTQNRDTQALHLKLDELIRVNQQARNQMIDLENLSEREILEVKEDLMQKVRSPRTAAKRPRKKSL